MGNKLLTFQDLNCKCSNNEKEHVIDVTEFYSEDYRDIITHHKPININGVDVTVMDLLNIPLASDSGIIDFIKSRIKIDITTQQGIDEINILFKKAIELYENRYLKHLPDTIRDITFKNTLSIIQFIRETKNNKKNGLLHCAILKVAYAVDDVLSNPKVGREKFLDTKFISEHLERPFQIEDGYEDKNGNIYRNGKVVIDNKIIKFKLIARQKGRDSIIGKQLAEAKYYSVDEFKDLVGVTIYIENDYEAALMMQYIDQMIYKGKAKIKNKNGLNLQNVKNNTFLNEEFYLKLEQATQKIDTDDEISDEEIEFNERKKGTAKKYREIKLVGNVELPFEEGHKASKYPVGTEIKFVVGGHDNEQGFSLQSIYDYIKKFRELTRLGIPIRKLDILNYVNDFFENIDEILSKKNKDKECYFIELYNDLFELGLISLPIGNSENQAIDKKVKVNEKDLAIGLFKYFESMLVKVKLPNSKKIYYYDESILKLRDAGLFPKIK